MSEVLAARAAGFLDQVLAAGMGPGGMLIDFLVFDTRRPFQEGEDQHWYLDQGLAAVWGPAAPRPTQAEMHYGENTLWVTGWLLWSQILRYRATQEPGGARRRPQVLPRP